MDISKDKIASLLNNPEIMSMISGLASGLAVGEKSEKESIPEEKTNADVKENDDGDVLLPTVKEKPFPIADTPKDRRIALLEAIKPYVSTSKRTKVDGLVKAIGVAGVLNTYTSAFFGNTYDD